MGWNHQPKRCWNFMLLVENWHEFWCWRLSITQQNFMIGSFPPKISENKFQQPQVSSQPTIPIPNLLWRFLVSWHRNTKKSEAQEENQAWDFWGVGVVLVVVTYTRWWLQIFFISIPIWRNDPNSTNIVQMGWNHQLVGILTWLYRFYQSCIM